jgi:hypothetical protein
MRIKLSFNLIYFLMFLFCLLFLLLSKSESKNLLNRYDSYQVEGTRFSSPAGLILRLPHLSLSIRANRGIAAH